MRTLFLDLASHSVTVAEGACIACTEDDRTAALRFIDHRIDDALLLPELESVLKEAGWTMEDIERIACVTGPGGFTSLRMAVTLANVLSDQLQIPLAGVHGSEVYAGRMSDELPVTSDEGLQKSQIRNSKLETRNSKLLWLHSTKKTQLFVRGFGEYASLWPEPALLSIDEFSEQVLPLSRQESGVGRERGPGGEGIPWAGELLPEHQTALSGKNLQEASLLPLTEALPGLLSGLSYQQHMTEPWYGRGW